MCRETVVRLGKAESAVVRSLERGALLLERVERLMTIKDSKVRKTAGEELYFGDVDRGWPEVEDEW
jgi:hypothetical protein